MHPNTPFLAVYMITYNHEKYIGQAIESIVSQRTNFNYKLFIGDDCSTDNTSIICEEFMQRHPDKIELLVHKKNIGATANAKSIYKKCIDSNAKYIAMCEGDDYWTDPYKLQKQIDFLEANLDYAIHYTNACYVVESENFVLNNKNKLVLESIESKHIDQKLLLNQNIIITLTTVFRNPYKPYPEWLLDVKLGDWSLHIINSLGGKIFYSNECTAVYRTHAKGIFSSLESSSQLLYYIETCKILESNLPEFKTQLKIGNHSRIIELLNLLYNKKDFLYYKILFKNYSSLKALPLLKQCIKGGLLLIRYTVNNIGINFKGPIKC